MTSQPVQIMQELSIDRKSQNSNQFTSKKILIKGDIEDEIDKINILNASILAMHKSILQLNEVEFISVDGNKFKNIE